MRCGKPIHIEGVIVIEIGIKAFGSFVPERRLTNEELAGMVDTNDAWIVERTGISERRIAGDGMTTSGMAAKAAQQVLASAGVSGDELAFVINSTCSPELTCPSMAARVGQAVALKGGLCFDLNAACSGFIYGLTVGASLLETRGGRYGLVTAGEKMTALTDYHDRASCILFGDGASAAVLTAEPPYHRILHSELGADPSGADLVTMGGQESHGTQAQHFFWQDGRKVFRFAVNILKDLIPKTMARAGIAKGDRYHIIPHQANLRMVEHVAEELEIPMERFVSNIQTHGNTSSASIGIALAEAETEQRFQPGDKLVLVGFGGGLTWAAMALEW